MGGWYELRNPPFHHDWGDLAIGLATGAAFLASARDGSHPGPDICATPASDVAGEAPFLTENDAAMKKMMDDMAVNPTATSMPISWR